jgi:catalytic LigB subunit of aromatic ring-opening dioxygenase
MAEIVVGIASSHTPQLSSGADMWPDHAERDRRNPQLLGRDARYHTYDELLAHPPPGLGPQLASDVWEAKYARCQDAIGALAESLRAARADVAIVIGDDQREMFLDDGIPAFACFAGSVLVDMCPPAEVLARVPAGIRAAYWAVHGEEPGRHPVASGLGMHVAACLTVDGFDLTLLTEQPAGRTLGHAFTFPRYRLGLTEDTPIVPVFVNTYYQPNVPSAARCYALGRSLRRAVSAWDSGARVAVVASGGLSHFVVDEDLDQSVLAALAAGDASALAALPRDRLRSGNSEILNWVTAAGALEGLRASVLDYVPGYRTPAGTGAGMAFAHWQ